MRKRAQRRYKPAAIEHEEISKKIKPSITKKQFRINRNIWIAVTLILIFFLVLFFNTYFNFTSDIAYNAEDEGLAKYYLSGPDPYYNMRLVEVTSETGQYPYYSENDPLLNYPVGRTGGRAPLLNMLAIGFSRFLTPFMEEVDALGLSMQFIPALFGALLIFPVYLIGKTLFNKKAGLIAAFLLAIIPIHIGSGHGSAFSLFDHDSLNLLLFFTTFLFLIFGLREKNLIKSILYAILGGVSLGALTMVWVDAQFLYVVITIYAVVQILINIFYNRFDAKVFTTTSIILLSGYLISLPVIISKRVGFRLDITLFLSIAVMLFGLLYYLLNKRKIPWLISLPTILAIGIIGLMFLYFIDDLVEIFNFLSPIKKLSNVLFGTGIYGNKVSMTIAEASTYQISNTVMSFGPALYWLGWAGLILLILHFYKDRIREDYLFIIVLFIVDLWLAGTAGRFLNDMVPLIALLGGWVTWYTISKIDYKTMIRNIRGAGGGLHGLRRGIKIIHVVGIMFFAFLLIFPNVFVTLDAAIPNKIYEKDDGNWTNLKYEVFGEGFSGRYGLSLNKEVYWADAFNWLREQDKEISDPVEKPAFISWWDYGFYEAALGGHPTVADNFQDGIPPASNFHTATSEKDAVAVWIVRLLEGDKVKNDGKLSDSVKQVLEENIGKNNSERIIEWIENPLISPSYGKWITEEDNEYISDEIREILLTQGAQWPENAVYHDVITLFNNETYGLSEEQVTYLYHDIQEATNLSIRYYGVEGYDRQIFNIFAFLSDKSLVLVGAPEDDFIEVTYSGYEINPITKNKTRDIDNELYRSYLELPDEDKRYIAITGTGQIYKDDYFDTMFYKTYIGPYDDAQGEKTVWQGIQHPCINMKHFYAEYISNISNLHLQYEYRGKAAVVIAKYYEGAIINGSVLFNGEAIDNVEVVVQKNIEYPQDLISPADHFPVDHDKSIILSDENPDGNFSVIAGAGGNLIIRRYPELVYPKFLPYGGFGFPIKTINFSSTTDPNQYPITDDDAMRKSDNYNRYLNISIEAGKLEGHIYENLDGNDTYNATADKIIKDANIILWEVLQFDEQQFKTSQSGSMVPSSISQDRILVTSNETGYSASNLLPGYYIVETYVDGYRYAANILPILSGNQTYNVSKPKLSGINGTVYYDANLNEKYDTGEEKSGADIKLYHIVRDSNGNIANEIFVNDTKSDSDGSYSFDSLIAGDVEGTKLNEYSLKISLPDYQKTLEEIYPEENKTTTVNVSLDLVPVNVTGEVTYNGIPMNNITIEFQVDQTEGENTAVNATETSDENGKYTISVKPGKYNVTASRVEGSTTVYESDVKNLSIEIGDDPKTLDFVLTKYSVTTTGKTSYDGADIGNISLTFEPDYEIENNTAIQVTTTSDENGIYTMELNPGTYNIYAYSPDQFTIDDVNYNYAISNQTNSLTVKDDEIDTGVTFNIILEAKPAT